VSGDGGGGCTGLACNVTDCDKMGMPRTTISGTVFAPNGTLPLFGVSVYVPNSDPGPFTPGVTCGNCSAALPGDPIAQTLTDEMGHFTLQNVPNGANIPLVVTIGKWRRQIKIASIAACTTQMLGAADTSLPKSHDDLTPNTTSVDLPQIAISTGQADSLECLVRRLGIADKEITTDAQAGRIHLFADTGAGGGVGTTSFDAGFGRRHGQLQQLNDALGDCHEPRQAQQLRYRHLVVRGRAARGDQTAGGDGPSGGLRQSRRTSLLVALAQHLDRRRHPGWQRNQAGHLADDRRILGRQ